MDLFSSLDHTERERDERLSGSRALIAAKARSRQQFGRYIAKAGSDSERDARIGMLEGEIRQVVEGACEDFEHDNAGGVLATVLTYLKTACPECGCDCKDGNCKCGNCSTCNKKEAAAVTDTGPDDYAGESDRSQGKGRRCPSCDRSISSSAKKCAECGTQIEKEAAAHPDGCGCSFPVCVKKREGANPDSEKEDEDEPSESELEAKADNVGKPFWEQVSYVHEAAPSVVDNDHSQKEMVDLPAADESGLGGPSPKMDHGTWTGLDPIDIGSKNHRHDDQAATDRAPYQEGPYHEYEGAGGYTGSDVPDQPNLKRVDIQKAMESPAHGDHTKVFPDGKHQADPVTSSWRILD